MLGVLIKKQMTELFRSFFYDNRNNKARSKGRTVTTIVLFAFLMVGVIGGMVAAMSFAMALSLQEAGMGWLFFTIIGLAAVLFGLIGSVFSTYATLYLAKDNELLLSMPIPVRYVILSRLISVYLVGLMYSGVILLPASAVYLIVTPFSAQVLAGCLLMTLIVSFIVLLLSCLLGWVVAAVAVKIKNKSIVTVIISVVFIAAYYYFYSHIQVYISYLIENAASWGDAIRGRIYPLYLFGRMGEGDPLAIVIFAAAVAVLCGLVWMIMSRTFLRMALAKGAVGRKAYREKGSAARSISAGLLAREFKRFTSSATYMLNTALGVLIIPAIAVVLLVRRAALHEMLTQVFTGAAYGLILPVFTVLGMFCISMTNTAVSSVSMEGKSLWILRTLPVTPRRILAAKLEVQLLVSGVPTLLYSILTAIALFPAAHPDPLSAVLYFVLPQVYNVLYALFCLSQGIRHAMLDWTNETVAVKNNVGALITIFSSWGITVGLASVGVPLALLSPMLGMAVMTLLSVGIALLFLRALRKKDEKLFAELN